MVTQNLPGLRHPFGEESCEHELNVLNSCLDKSKKPDFASG